MATKCVDTRQRGGAAWQASCRRRAAPIQPLPSGAPFQLVLSTHLALLSWNWPPTARNPKRRSWPTTASRRCWTAGCSLARRRGWRRRRGTQPRRAAAERDALLLVDVPARAVVGSWTLPTLPARPGRGGRRRALRRRFGAGRRRRCRLLAEAPAGWGARCRRAGAARAARPPARCAPRRRLRLAATAHASSAIAQPGCSVLHNNLQSTSELHLFELATGAPVRTLLLGGPNCHNPLFYKGELLYLLSSSGGLARLRADGGSTTLWEAGSEWFTKGLAVVDDVAYFGLSRKTRQARDATSPPWSSRRSTSPPAPRAAPALLVPGLPRRPASSTPSARPHSRPRARGARADRTARERR